MLWLRRLLPLFILSLIFIAFWLYRDYSDRNEKELNRRTALLTAKVWVASAIYRAHPEQFVAFRDSLLSASGTSRQEIQNYMHLYESKPERYYDFTTAVSKLIDSLVSIEDSLRRETDSADGEIRQPDSSATEPPRKRPESAPVFHQ